MRVILYTASSFGGCYDYALQLHEAYSGHPRVESVISLFPQNASLPARSDMRPMLMPDVRSGSARQKRLHFLQRSVRNPLRLLRYLQSAPPSLVVFNDWEQITAPFWVPMFMATLGRRHKYAVILHDPDRDAYPPNLATSTRCMKALMSIMDLGLYHDLLPQKAYYAPNGRTRYVDVPHGLYPAAEPDAHMLEYLERKMKPALKWAAILGNIRPEKNYDLAIEALKRFPQVGLVIAGKPSNSRVDVTAYHSLASALGVQDRILWIDKFLTDAEMSAVIKQTDYLLLYYAKSFTSQSGVLNTAAPFRKTIIASDGASSLATTLKKFNVGILVQPDSIDQLCLGIGRALDGFGPDQADWGAYLEYARWDAHVEKVLQAAEG